METVGETCSKSGSSGSDGSDTLVSAAIVVLPADCRPVDWDALDC